MRLAVQVPLFDGLSDPAHVARLAAAAEEAGWDGFFVWDHTRWHAPVVEVGDPQIVLAAIAIATERVRIGPLISPLPRRRPVKVIRELASLDQLSGGRVTLGVGIGSDMFGDEFAMVGEETDERRRGDMLDESLEVLRAAWTGEPVHHAGEHYTIDGMQFLPRPVQRPGVPVWVGGWHGKRRPLRRAALHQGYFPIVVPSPDALAEDIAALTELRRELGRDLSEPYDIVSGLRPGMDAAPWAAAGATWAVYNMHWDAIPNEQVLDYIREGPPR